VQYERSIQLVRFHRVANKSAEATHAAVVANDRINYTPNSSKASHTTAAPKGRPLETGGSTMASTPSIAIQYCSWQKGGVENVNGIIRRYLPIETDLSQNSDGGPFGHPREINNRPRKASAGITPKRGLIERYSNSQMRPCCALLT